MEQWAPAASAHVAAAYWQLNAQKNMLQQRMQSMRSDIPAEENFVKTHPSATEHAGRGLQLLRFELAHLHLAYHSFDTLCAFQNHLLEETSVLGSTPSHIDPLKQPLLDTIAHDSAETAAEIRQFLSRPQPSRPAADTTVPKFFAPMKANPPPKAPQLLKAPPLKAPPPLMAHPPLKAPPPPKGNATLSSSHPVTGHVVYEV